MIIVDASVAVQWVSEEITSELSEALLSRDDLAAPEFMLVEAANALYRKVYVGEASQEHAVAGLEFIRDKITPLPVPIAILGRAISLANEMHHAVYDCLYLALAEAHGAVIATWDQEFVDRARHHGYGKYVSYLPLS